MKNYNVRHFLSAYALIFSSIGSVEAQVAAPVNSTGTDQLGEIIVTAERRSESLQKSALTIQVLEPTDLGNAGITQPNLLTSALPTVQIGTSGPVTAVYVRGVGGFAGGSDTNPAVPYYADGVYVARTQSLVSEMYDVERLELVTGPQGTLYGRNASGGAINVLTVRPKLGVYEGHGAFELGNYDNKNGEFAVNLPLSETIAARLSGTVVDKGGFTSERFGDDKHAAGRGKILWQPSDQFSFLLNGSYGEVSGRSSAAVVPLNRAIAGWYPWLDITDPRTQAFVVSTAIAAIPGVPDVVRPLVPGDARQDLRFYNISGELNWDVGFANLTVIPAYRNTSSQYEALEGFLVSTGYTIGDIPARPETSHYLSLEARLAGNWGRLKYVVGLFHDNEDQLEQYSTNGGLLQQGGVRATIGARSTAAFGQGTFEIVDRVRLIGGLRYTSDRRAIDGQSYIVSPTLFLGPPPLQAAACAFPAPTEPQCVVDIFAGTKTFTNVSFKAGVEADVLANSLFYVTVARGFKAGGFNEESAFGAPGAASLIRPEILTSYETGLKSRFLDNRLQINGSVYYWDYQDHQEPVVTYTNVPGVTDLVFFNAGKSTIYGATVDGQARVWRGGTFATSVQYAHSRYDTFNETIPTFSYSPASSGCRVASQDPANTTLDCSGFEVSRTPEWSGDIGLTQEVALSRGKLVSNGILTFATARWLGTDFIPIERGRGYGKLDLSGSYQPPVDHWSITGFVRNVTNAVIYTDGSKNPFSSLVYADIQPPRTYGARFEFNF